VIEILSGWEAAFLGSPPLAHEIREAFADSGSNRWVRFHSLPHSKRYPENEAEFSEVLARFNSLLGALVAVQGSCRVTLLTTAGSLESTSTQPPEKLRALDAEAKHWRSVVLEEAQEGLPRSYWNVFASTWAWSPGVFNSVVRQAAMWEIVNVMMVPPDLTWMIHPYDGGVDVITRTPEECGILRAKYRAWLSTHPSGK
jgi:hypothetical protein